MDYITYNKRIQYVLSLVKNKRLLSPVELAEKLECSEKTIRRMINELRMQGHPIKYSKSAGRYILEGVE